MQNTLIHSGTAKSVTEQLTCIAEHENRSRQTADARARAVGVRRSPVGLRPATVPGLAALHDEVVLQARQEERHGARVNAVAVVVRRHRGRQLLPVLKRHDRRAPQHLQPQRWSQKKEGARRTELFLTLQRATGTHRVHEVQPQRRGQQAPLPVLLLEPRLDREVILGEHHAAHTIAIKDQVQIFLVEIMEFGLQWVHIQELRSKQSISIIIYCTF